MKEIWKDIPGYEGLYQVSNLGNVKSLSNNQSRKEKILKPGVNKSGYCRIILAKNSIHKTYTLHQLVAMCFLDHIPSGMKLVVDHINDIKTDNRLENLQIITQRENVCRTQGKYSSQYRGVSWDKRAKKWKSRIIINRKYIHLGYFANEYDAHLKYKETLKNL